MEVLVGADPELFLLDQNKSFVSAHERFPGTKDNPFPVRAGAIQVDGVALEFNIKPSDKLEGFLTNINSVLTVCRQMSKKQGLVLQAQPTAVFDPGYFTSLPDKAKELGCEPDYNAWNQGEMNEPPHTDQPFRTGSGHLHIGWTEDEDPFDKVHFADCINVTRQLDTAMFIPSLLWDDDDRRRNLYGKIGAFRPKTYGVEWRPLSNAWVTDEDIQEWLFKSIQRSMELLEEDTHLYDTDPFLAAWVDVVRSGNKVNRHEALDYYNILIDRYKFPELIDWYVAG